MTVTEEERAVPNANDPAVRDATKRAKKEAWVRRGPLLPAMLFTIVVTQLPFVATLIISFRNWNTNHPERYGWAGFKNYKRVFSGDSQLLKDVWHTVELTVVVVLVSLILGLGIALLLNRSFPGRGIVRTFMIAPFLIVPVAAALFFKFGIFDANTGLLNGIITMVHRWFDPGATASAIDFLGHHPMLCVEITLIWQWTPFMTLILLAGLQSRPAEVLEAASVDGASPWQMFTNMTLPHMRQYLELAGLLGAIYLIQNFDAVFIITPLNVDTENLPNAIYQTIFSANDNGLASAQGVIIVIGTIIIATFALRTVSSLFKEEEGR